MYTTRVRLKNKGPFGLLKYSEEALIKERDSSSVFVKFEGDEEDTSVTASYLDLVEHEAVGFLKRIISLDKQRNIYYQGRGYDMKAYQEAIEILEQHFNQ